jgi:protoporphyrinogen/coproporphyrinogen III oxidase
MSTADARSAPVRIAVVGGGLSGLAAAHRVCELAAASGRDLELTVFEAGSRWGGVVGTRRIGEYLVELGADMFITNKPAGVELCRRLGIDGQLISTENKFRKSLVLSRGKPVEVPDGFLLLAPHKIWPILKSPIFSWRGKLRMGWERFVPRKVNGREDESLASFVRRRFGAELLDRLVQPLVGGIYTADPEKLSLQATLPRFLEMERVHGSLIKAGRLEARRKRAGDAAESGARYGLFVSFPEGLQTLVDALVEKLQAPARLRLNAAVVSVARDDRRWMLELANGTHEEFDGVLSALPAYRTAELCTRFAPDLAEELRQIEYASSAVVVSGYRLDEIEHPLDSFGLVIPAIERRGVLAVSFTSRKFPGRAPEGKVILRTFVGGALQPEKLELSEAQLLQLVREELRELLGVRGQPDFEVLARYERAMPQYHVGHPQRVKRLEQLAARQPGFAFSGNAYHGVGVPDTIASGEAAAERLFAAVSSGG